ncbi:hypothetical protein VPJ68_01060, partial [Parabacteroides distasonis]
ITKTLCAGQEAADPETVKGSKTENRADARITITSGFPWNGRVSVKVETESEAAFTIALRIPDWCETYTAKGLEGAQTVVRDGYLYVTKVWKQDGGISLEFPMKVRMIQSNPRVREDIGKVA